MTYFYEVFKPQPGMSPADAATRVITRDCPAMSNDPEAIAWRESLIRALVKVDPRLEVFKHGMDASHWEEGPPRRYVELEAPLEEGGVQIALYDYWASISVPLGHVGTMLEQVFARIWNYLRVFQVQAGMLAYDPQSHQLIDVKQQSQPDHSGYLAMIQVLREELHSADP